MSQQDNEGADDPLSISYLLKDIDFDEEKHQSDILEAAQFSDKSKPVDEVRFFHQNELSHIAFLGKDAAYFWDEKWNTSWSMKIEGNSTEETKLSYLSKGAACLNPGNDDAYVLRFFCGLNDNQEDPILHMMKNLIAQLLCGFQKAGKRSLHLKSSGKSFHDMDLDGLLVFFLAMVERSHRMIYIILDHVSCYRKPHKRDMIRVLIELNTLVTMDFKYVHTKLILTSPTLLEYVTTRDPEEDWYILVDGCSWPYGETKACWETPLEELLVRTTNRIQDDTG